jgi:hypothetical protein
MVLGSGRGRAFFVQCTDHQLFRVIEVSRELHGFTPYSLATIVYIDRCIKVVALPL